MTAKQKFMLFKVFDCVNEIVMFGTFIIPLFAKMVYDDYHVEWIIDGIVLVVFMICSSIEIKTLNIRRKVYKEYDAWLEESN